MIIFLKGKISLLSLQLNGKRVTEIEIVNLAWASCIARHMVTLTPNYLCQSGPISHQLLCLVSTCTEAPDCLLQKLGSVWLIG